MTPTTLDFLGWYGDGVQALTDQLVYDPALKKVVSYKTSLDGNVTAAIPGQVNAGTRAAAFVSYPNNSLAYDINRPAGSTWHHKPRGS